MDERLSSRRVYDGIVIDIDLDEVRLPNGCQARLETARHPGASAALPVHADGSVSLIRQYRYATGGYIVEVPAGKLDPGEDRGECARRGSEEEAGLRPGRLHALGWIWTTPGFTDEKIHLFAATGLDATAQTLQEDEVIEVLRVPFEEALAMATRGGITDAKSLCTIFRAWRAVQDGSLAAAGPA